jgi:predicted Ser/Thr protein kinase
LSDSSDSFLRKLARTPDQEPGGPPPERLGHFRILDRLGRGGMGVVYRAVDETLGREVALKVLPPAFEQSEERRRRLLREARVAAQVSHPNLVTVYEIDEAEGRVFIAMELVAGRSLRQALNDSLLGTDEALRVFREILRGVARAHERGVVHRDLKPDNVMLADDGATKVLDFGLARLTHGPGGPGPDDVAVADTQSKEGLIAGTPGYMAPEQAAGHPLDPRADVFSLGVILHELLSGERPFKGSSDMDVLMAVARDQPELPPVGEELRAVLARCLAKDPAGRYADAGAVLRALQGIDPGEAVPRPRPSVRPRPASDRWALARGRRGGAVVACVAALLAGGLLLRRAGRRPPGVVVPPQGVALACPIFVASGVEEPAGWLGAAAASLACTRATVLLGGLAERTLIPAELLELPPRPTDDYPADPHGAPGARARSLAAARRRAPALLDGEVARLRDGYRVTLILRSSAAAAGEELGKSSATAAVLPRAVATAMDALVTSAPLPRVARLDPRAALWIGTEDLAAWLALHDYGRAVAAYDWGPELLAVERHRAGLGALSWTIEDLRRQVDGVTRVGPRPPLDRSSPDRFALTALLRPAAEASGLAEEAHVLLERAADPLARSVLARTEAFLHLAGGDRARARAAALVALAASPRDEPVWTALGNSGMGSVDEVADGRPRAAWVPHDAPAWNVLSAGLWRRKRCSMLPELERAWLLAPAYVIFAGNLVAGNLECQRREAARTVAADLSASPAGRRAGRIMELQAAASEGRFEAVFTRGREMMLGLDRLGATLDGWIFKPTFDMALILGRLPGLADELIDRFVLVEPPRVAEDHWSANMVATVCGSATTTRSGPCFARLRQLLARDWFRFSSPTSEAVVEGSERYARGDLAGAAASWRRLIPSLGPGVSWLAYERGPDVYDAVGEPEVAQRLDAPRLVQRGYNGAGPALVREARRAARRGDHVRARQLARQVIEAWSVADTRVPAVAEMRTLLEELGR